MPNFFSGLFPTFGADKDQKKMVVKAETYALGYALGITVAKVFPQTAGPIGLALGLELAPGKGIKIKPAALPLIYAPQPVGVMPPHYYHLPDIMGEPLDLAKILAKPNSRANLRARVEADYAIRDAEIIQKQQVSVREATAYQRQFLEQLQAGRIPDRPTPAQVLGLDRFAQGGRGLASLDTLNSLAFVQGPDGTFYIIDQVTGQKVAAFPARDGGAMGIAPPESTSGVGPLVGGFVFVDQFFAANPPDP